MSSDTHEHPLAVIRESYRHLRLASPKAEAAMEGSVRLYGQISPVVCLRVADGIELIDGFKRLRVMRKLERPTIRATFLETTVRACKACIIQLNRVARSITDLEEAMVLQSLYRDEGLSQVEIATMLGRDKSWVSRRLSLIERLADEVRQHLELGLISASVGRELARLPRGNQVQVLPVVLKRRLGKREVEQLVRHLLSRPQWNHAAILANVGEVLSPHESAPATTAAGFSRQLGALQRLQRAITDGARRVAAADERPSPSLLVTTIESTRKVEMALESLLAGRTPEETL